MTTHNQSEDHEFQNEYQVIKKDIRKVVVVNLLIVILLVGLYFADAKYGLLAKLEKFF